MFKSFQSDCWWEGQKLQNNDSKSSSWGRDVYLYNLERDKTSWNIPKDPHRISVQNSIQALIQLYN